MTESYHCRHTLREEELATPTLFAQVAVKVEKITKNFVRTRSIKQKTTCNLHATKFEQCAIQLTQYI